MPMTREAKQQPAAETWVSLVACSIGAAQANALGEATWPHHPDQ